MDARLPLVLVVIAQCLEVDLTRAASIASLAASGQVAQPLRRWLWRTRNAQKAAQRWKMDLADRTVWMLSEKFAREWMEQYGVGDHWHPLMEQWTPYSTSKYSIVISMQHLGEI